MIKKTIVQKPFQIIIFGASGDLASLMLFPAIYNLYAQKRLPENFQIIGYGRTKLTRNQFQKIFHQSIVKKYGQNPYKLTQLIDHLYFFSGPYDDLKSYENLNQFCKKLAGTEKVDQVAYFSVPPVVFADLIVNLSKTIKNSNNKLKLVIEKPFGTSEKTAQELVKILGKHFDQRNIYMLDHYLGKIPVQSIIQLRMENNIINQLLNGDLISNIQLTAFETADIGQRIGYFEHTGIIRDMLQSHLLQILSLITMDIPNHPNRNSLEREKYALLSAVHFSGKKDDLVIGQYQGYQKLRGVKKNSKTDTFAAVKLSIDRRQWFDVPIFMRAGKKLGQTISRVVIEFKTMPFQNHNCAVNKLIFEMKPAEKIELILYKDAKHSKSLTKMGGTVSLAHNLACVGDECLTEYATLILDILNGKKDYFLSINEVLASWKITDDIMKTKNRSDLLNYKGGSEGPKSQYRLTKKENFYWYES